MHSACLCVLLTLPFAPLRLDAHSRLRPPLTDRRTYTTPYMGDLHFRAHMANGNDVGHTDSRSRESSPAAGDSQQQSSHPAASGEDADGAILREAQVRWRSSAQQIDRSALMTRDPILFYDEVPLHMSELDDNGLSQLTVKVRRHILHEPVQQQSYRGGRLFLWRRSVY